MEYRQTHGTKPITFSARAGGNKGSNFVLNAQKLNEGHNAWTLFQLQQPQIYFKPSYNIIQFARSNLINTVHNQEVSKVIQFLWLLSVPFNTQTLSSQLTVFTLIPAPHSRDSWSQCCPECTKVKWRTQFPYITGTNEGSAWHWKRFIQYGTDHVLTDTIIHWSVLRMSLKSGYSSSSPGLGMGILICTRLHREPILGTTNKFRLEGRLI